MTFRSKVDRWYCHAIGVLGMVGHTAYRTQHLLPPYLLVPCWLASVWLLAAHRSPVQHPVVRRISPCV